MRACNFLDRADQLPVARLADLLGAGAALILAPHPDDESLGCGGLIAAAADEGRLVHIVFISDGVGSHPNSKSYPPARLSALRETEARAAVSSLGRGLAAVTFLRLPDRAVPARSPEADNAVSTISALAMSTQAGSMFVTWRHDPHCDHQATYAIARLVQNACPSLRLFEYPIWGRSLPDDSDVGGPPKGFRLDITAYHARKRAAVACHRSQLTTLIDDDPAGFRLDASMLARFQRDHEVFLELDA